MQDICRTYEEKNIDCNMQICHLPLSVRLGWNTEVSIANNLQPSLRFFLLNFLARRGEEINNTENGSVKRNSRTKVDHQDI